MPTFSSHTRSGEREHLGRPDAGAVDGAAEAVEVSASAPAHGAVETTPSQPHVGPFYALRFRNFRLFFVGQLISVAGTWMQTVAQGWLVWELTHQARWLGIVSGASAVPYVLFSFKGGEAADRLPRRTILVWSQTLSMILAFALAALATNRWLHIEAWYVALMAGLLGIVNAYNMPAQQAFVTDMVDEREALGNAIALNSLRFNLARFIGPIFAGWTLAKTGAAMCFFLNGLSFIAVIISLLLMRLPQYKPHPARLPIAEGFRYIRTHASVLRIIVLIGAGSLFTWSASTIFPTFASMFHKGAQGYSTLLAVNGIGAAAGGLAVAIFGTRVSRRGQVYGGSFVFCLALLWLAAAHAWPIVLACLGVSGFSMIVLGISANTRVQEQVPDNLRGRVMAVYTLVFSGVMPVGGLEAGFLADHIGVQVAVGINAALCLAVTVGLYAWAVSSARTATR